MNQVCVGCIINTHGIKGEVKVDTNFQYKEEVFKPNFNIYVEEEKLTIKTVRVHKGYILITFNNIYNINDVLKYKGVFIYVDKDDLKLKENQILHSDLIGFSVYDEEEKLGVVTDIINNHSDILVVKSTKKILIPLVDQFIKKIDVSKKTIYINVIEGLL